MWYQIFKFELEYRKKRPATYIYFGILLIMAAVTMSTDVIQIGGASGLVKENSPATVATMMGILTAAMAMITSAVMGVSILRDFEHGTESMMFTTPITKLDYLLGRFLGSYLVVVLIFMGVPFGFMIGDIIQQFSEPDKVLPFNSWTYFHPFLYFVIPNLFFTGVLFFFTGALSRKMLIVYVQWMILFVFYQIALTLTSEVDNQNIAAILDPFALTTINNTTQYWTVAEQNAQVIPIEGVVLQNRLLWIGVGIIFAIIGYFAFSFNVVRNSWFKKKNKEAEDVSNTAIELPKVGQNLGLGTYFLQIWTQAKFYFWFVLKGIPFQAIALFGFVILIINSFFIGRVFGTYTYPTTYLILQLIQGAFSLFFIIIVVFYSGELIWRERDVKINLIQDSLPSPDFVSLISKFLGLILVYVSLTILLIFFGVVVQAFKGFYEFRLDLYFTAMFTETFSFLVLFTLLAFFIQVMVNNKFLGHALLILFFITMGVLDSLGLEHSLFQFGSASLGTYSEMNGFGHFVTGFSWFDLYWLAFSIFLFAVSVMFAVRGSEAAMKWRWKVGLLRLQRPLITFGITAFMVFGLSGCYIYYNTNVLNTYANSEEIEAFQADYERTYKKYEHVPQPKVTDMNFQVELYPMDRNYSVEGYYILVNMEDHPIDSLHIQLDFSDDYKHEYLTLDKESLVALNDEKFKYLIYDLEEPLQPGDSMKFSFKQEFTSSGFKESGSNTGIVFNGTFLNNISFPQIGYNAGSELASDNTRKDNDLEPKERLPPRSNKRGLSRNFISDDSHGINFEIIIGTEKDQTAVAPGYLQREWMENDRKYFHYKMDKPMLPFFNIVSARYEVMRDKTTINIDSATTQDINLEIYYHEGHEYNLESMMKGLKNSFTYFSENFSPYQYRQMRILEFPRYSSFAQSFANTVPFSEAIGFMLKIEEEDDVDVAYFVTAHEIAHQWWAHQVIAADVQGSQVLSETLSQYSALMVMKHEYPREHMQEFLKEELNRYLSGRNSEQKKELPLALAENQQYIHYGKGANIMYALQDYIGEDSVNAALKRLATDWQGRQNGRYPTTIDFMGYIRAVTPDSLQNLVTDMFEKIVLFENKTDESYYNKVSDDEYVVTIDLDVKKFEADSVGNTNEVALSEWIDIGIYTEDEEGEEKLIYLKKHLISDQDTKLEIKVTEKPVKAGIDPLNILIDRNPDDNIEPCREESTS